jgi:hypothetical protein
MAFIDCDEFFIIRDKRVPDLPRLLLEYEGYGGLAVNWQVSRFRSDADAKADSSHWA